MTGPNERGEATKAVDIEVLRELLARAIPGPWKAGWEQPNDFHDVQGPDRGNEIYDHQVLAHLSADDCVDRRESFATMRLIAMLRNAAPALFDELEAARKVVEAVRKRQAGVSAYVDAYFTAAAPAIRKAVSAAEDEMIAGLDVYDALFTRVAGEAAKVAAEGGHHGS